MSNQHHRVFPWALALLAGFCLLQPAMAQAQAPIELAYWYANAGVVQQTNESLVKTFNETVGKTKGIHVTPTFQGGYADIQQKVQASTIAGNPPDVYAIEVSVTALFAQSDMLEQLDPYIARDSMDLKDFQQGLMGNGTRVNGKYYALPFMASNLVLYLNTTLLKSAGLDPAGPKTWDELASYCKTIKEKTGAYGMTLSSNAWLMEALMLTSGSSILSDDGSSANFNTKEALNAIKFFGNLKDQGYIRILSAAETPKLISDMQNQKCAMWFYTSAGITTFMGMGKTAGFGVNVAYIPKLASYGTANGGANLVMSKKSSKQEKDAAWEFMKWMTAAEQAAFTSSRTGYLPIRKSTAQSAAMKAVVAQIPQFQIAMDQMVYADRVPLNPGYVEGANVIAQAMDAVWISGQNPETVLNEAQKKLNRLLKE
jgi:sn-glycerol 3-phosphate transport system substrate-binding protein